MGQRDLPPRRLGRRRGGRPVVPGAAHGQRPSAADEPDLPDRATREWEDYAVEVGVRPCSLDDMAGVVFRYHTNRHYYLFALMGGRSGPAWRVRLPLERLIPRWPSGASWRRTAFPYDTTRITAYTWRTRARDPRVHRRPPDPPGRGRRAARVRPGSPQTSPRGFQDFHVQVADGTKRRRSTRGSPARGRSSPSCAARTHGPSRGSSSLPRSSRAGRNRPVRRPRRRRRARDAHRQNIPRIGDNFIQISCPDESRARSAGRSRSGRAPGRPDPRNGLLTD